MEVLESTSDGGKTLLLKIFTFAEVFRFSSGKKKKESKTPGLTVIKTYPSAF